LNSPILVSQSASFGVGKPFLGVLQKVVCRGLLPVTRKIEICAGIEDTKWKSMTEATRNLSIPSLVKRPFFRKIAPFQVFTIFLTFPFEFHSISLASWRYIFVLPERV